MSVPDRDKEKKNLKTPPDVSRPDSKIKVSKTKKSITENNLTGEKKAPDNLSKPETLVKKINQKSVSSKEKTKTTFLGEETVKSSPTKSSSPDTVSLGKTSSDKKNPDKSVKKTPKKPASQKNLSESENASTEKWMDLVGKNVPESIKKIYFSDISPEDLSRFIREIKSAVSSKKALVESKGSKVQQVISEMMSKLNKSDFTNHPVSPVALSDTEISLDSFSLDRSADKKSVDKNISYAEKKINTISRIVAQAIDYQRAYAAVSVGEIIPPHVKSLSRSLHETMIRALEDSGDITSLLSAVYQNPLLSIEQKALLREEVVKIFSVHTSKIIGTDEVLVVEVFGLPAFGKISEAKRFLSNKKSMDKLCSAMISSGCLSPKSQTVALLGVPLKWSSLSKASVLHSLSAAWGSLVAQQDFIDEATSNEIMNSVMRDLDPYIAETGKMAFVIAGVRVWRGRAHNYQKETADFITQWFRTSPDEKAVGSSWWSVAVGRALLEDGVPPGSLMIRSPAPPLVTQSQSLAWHVSQQIYERLGMNPFQEINFVSVSDSKLVLRAYNHKNTIIAQSDFVSLFDVVSSAEDFSALLKDECSSSGPRTQLQELRRTMDP